MESSYFKKSPNKLSPSTKPNEMTDSGVTVWLTDGQGTPDEPETPAQMVLRLPELLSIIFGHLATDSDVQSLKNARVVCSMWKHEVYVTLQNNLALVPYILVEHPKSNSLKHCVDHPHKSLQSSMESLLPGCGFPLKLVVNKWTRQLESFMCDFSKEIVEFLICGFEQFYGFPVDLGAIELPKHRHSLFIAKEICSHEGKRIEFVKALNFWKELLRVSKNLKTSSVHLEICELDPLPPDNSAFDQIEWREVSDLQCSSEFFACVSASEDLLRLQYLICYSSDERNTNEYDLAQQISLAKATNLSTVELKEVKWILDHQMKKLKILCLEEVKIRWTQPPSKLLSNLEEIYIIEGSMGGITLDCLTTGGGAFKKVSKLNYTENWIIVSERIGGLAAQLCESFPNLTELAWQSKDVDEEFASEDYNNNALHSAPVVFERLEFLTCLELSVVWPSESELVELLAGLTMEHIPEKEDCWPSTLVDNPHSITNLKHLKEFHLDIAATSVSVSSRNSRFLFVAAFRTMQTLEKLFFRCIIFEDSSCVMKWKQMGRQIRLLNVNGDRV